MNRETVSLVIDFLAALTIFAQVFIVVFGLVYLLHRLNKKNKTLKDIIGFFSANSLYFALLVATVATTGSLFLSEIAKFVPCNLCWYQRIFMYPQVILLGVATLTNDLNIKKYVLPLVGIGIAIATYHYALQMSPFPLPCTDEVASCAAKQAARFGYITIPMMSWTAFLLVGILMLLSKPLKK